jgi:hypothetical protein
MTGLITPQFLMNHMGPVPSNSSAVKEAKENINHTSTHLKEAISNLGLVFIKHFVFPNPHQISCGHNTLSWCFVQFYREFPAAYRCA